MAVSAKYTGPTMHERVISKKDFKSRDIEVEKDVVFSEENDHTFDLTGFSDEAIALLEKQPNIKVTKTETSSNQSKPAAR